MHVYEIKDAIFDKLSESAREAWNGADASLINEFVILAQRYGVEHAANEFESCYSS